MHLILTQCRLLSKKQLDILPESDLLQLVLVGLDLLADASVG